MKGYSKFIVEIVENIDGNGNSIKIKTDREIESQLQNLIASLCQSGSNINVRLIDHQLFNV